MKKRLLLSICILCAWHSAFGQDNLLDACHEHADFKAIEKLIKLGFDVNETDQYGRTPLILLCRTTFALGSPVIRPDAVQSIKALVAAGADVNAACNESVERTLDPNFGATPLIMASYHMPAYYVRALLDAKANPNKADKSGYAPLMWACRSPRDPIEKLRLLIAAGADVHAVDFASAAFTAFDVKALAYLLQHATPADVNRRDSAGDTSLNFIARLGDVMLEATRLLLAAGAEVNTQNSRGESPLFNDQPKNCEQTVSALLSAGINVNLKDARSRTALWCYVFWPKPEIVQKLISAGAEVNISDADGYTPLHLAAGSGSEENVRMLLGAGAEANVVNKDGNTPLVLAVARSDGSPGIVRDLLSAGAKVDYRGSHALTGAVGKKETFQLLLQAKPDPNTAVLEAVQLGDAESLSALVAAGADVNKADRDGNTLLMHARTAAIVRILIDAGVKVNAKNHWKMTALMMLPAQMAAHSHKEESIQEIVEVVRMLLEKGADKKAKDAGGKTAYYYASGDLYLKGSEVPKLLK
jgi:ankyrin repeat protein